MGYDDLAEYYDLIFEDWPSAVRRQGRILSDLLIAEVGRPRLSVLDAACGIGTQSIGLALQGHEVHATDISESSVMKAAARASEFGVQVTTQTADLLKLDSDVEGTFDAVIACDNSLPHLLSNDDIVQALSAAQLKLNPDGVLLISIRDFDALAESKPSHTPIRTIGSNPHRRLVFQMWEWKDDVTWTPELFIVQELESGWDTKRFKLPPYRGIRVSDMNRLFEQAGFDNVQVIDPSLEGYYQPIVMGSKPR